MSTRTGRLQLDEDLTFQRREWRVQRVAWWVLSGIVLAALLGVFGGGPLSSAAAASADGALRIDYERFVRAGSTTRLTIRVEGSPHPSGLELEVDRPYFEAMRVEHVAPDPVDVAVGSSIVTLRFTRVAAGTLTLLVDAQPVRAGSLTSSVRVRGGASVAIRQFSYF